MEKRSLFCFILVLFVFSTILSASRKTVRRSRGASRKDLAPGEKVLHRFVHWKRGLQKTVESEEGSPFSEGDEVDYVDLMQQERILAKNIYAVCLFLADQRKDLIKQKAKAAISGDRVDQFLDRAKSLRGGPEVEANIISSICDSRERIQELQEDEYEGEREDFIFDHDLQLLGGRLQPQETKDLLHLGVFLAGNNKTNAMALIDMLRPNPEASEKKNSFFGRMLEGIAFSGVGKSVLFSLFKSMMGWIVQSIEGDVSDEVEIPAGSDEEFSDTEELDGSFESEGHNEDDVIVAADEIDLDFSSEGSGSSEDN